MFTRPDKPVASPGNIASRGPAGPCKRTKNTRQMTKEKFILHRNFQILFRSDYEAGEILDTEVRIFPAYNSAKKEMPICVIAGSEIDNFIKEFVSLIDKYHI